MTQRLNSGLRADTYCNVTWALICCAVSFTTTTAQAADRVDPAKGKPDAENADLVWFDVRELRIEGQGWKDTKEPFDRLPARAEKLVRDAVWNLSRDSAGICARFHSNSPAIQARWKLRSDRLAMPHMAATGVSGVDLYVRAGQAWRWVAVGQPKAQTAQAALVSGIPAIEREYLIYLPLYNGIQTLEIGVSRDSTLLRADPRPEGRDKPIVFYGTSITHGACASRPGMVHTAILGRRFDWSVINLGFSGNGRMEPEVAKLLSEIEAAAYVIDCLPNIQADEVSQRTEPLVKILRAARPKTPIILVEDRSYADSHLVDSKRQRNLASRKALRQAYDRLVAAGDTILYYIEGEPLLGDDYDGTVDSSHPNDLGFVRQADAFQAVLRPILTRR